MQIQTLIQYVAAVGAVLGGLDWICGNRFGAGQKFEDGFRLMGTLAFSMTGIMMMAPVVVAVLRPLIAPICHLLRLDTAGVAALLCVDMGGYPLAMQMAQDGAVGQFVGVVLTATLGCTLSFTIPVGFGMVSKENQPFLVQGLLAGLMTLPIGCIMGGWQRNCPCRQCSGTCCRPPCLRSCSQSVCCGWKPVCCALFAALQKGCWRWVW